MRLSTENLSIRRGGRAVLNDISINVEDGQLVGLIGPNGAGKTTLLRALAHLSPPTTGRVLCDGRHLAEFSPMDRARRIAYLAQDAEVHWPMTAEKLVALGRLPHRSFWGRLFDRDAIETAMQETDTIAYRTRTLATLSGGERMRVLLARALSVQAPTLLADEPVAALDPFHQLKVMDVLKQTARSGKAVVAVLHDLTLAARFCDRVLLLHQGSVLAEGPPAVVLDERNLEAAYSVRFVRGTHAGQEFIVPWHRQ